MQKLFTTVLPDEPYKTATTKNTTIDCTYTGKRYVLVRMNNDGSMYACERQSDSLEDIENCKLTAAQLASENHFQVVIDAEINPWEAAHLTHDYEHGEVPNYNEVLATGDTWEYTYDDHSGALNQPFYTNDMRYDRATNSWLRPRYRVHALTRDSFMSAIAEQAAEYERAAASDKYSGERLDTIKAHAAFLKSLPTKYANIDHWKIPYPTCPSLF